MSSTGRRSPDRRAVAVAVAVIVVLVVLYGAALVRGHETPHAGASVQDLQDAADDVVHERWAFGAPVHAVLSKEVIVVGGPQFGTAPMPVLLTTRARDIIDDGVRAGDIGQFVGRFRRLDVDRLERQTRGELPDDRLEHLEGGLLLVADRAAIDQRAR